MTYSRWIKTCSKEQVERLKNSKHHDFDKDNQSYRGPFIPYEGSNSPKAGQWDGRKMCQRMIADYKRFVVADGEGVRNSLYVSGCPFHCEGCFQPSIFNFNVGFPYSDELEAQILDDLKYSYVNGITFLGGEPMLNTPILISLAQKIRAKYGDSKTIWSWTGYTWEELMREGETPDKLELLKLIDILVDGRFMKPLFDPKLQFRGSSNQRIIDVQKSLENPTGNPVIWDKLEY